MLHIPWPAGEHYAGKIATLKNDLQKLLKVKCEDPRPQQTQLEWRPKKSTPPLKTFSHGMLLMHAYNTVPPKKRAACSGRSCSQPSNAAAMQPPHATSISRPGHPRCA
jgi:hypothetical protein